MSLLLWLSLLTVAAFAETEIPLVKQGGVYTLPVRINGVITLNFVLDSGASEVCLPADVVKTLTRTGTLTAQDFLPGKAFSLADGSVLRSERFIIRELELGGQKLFNVRGAVTPSTGFLLLGQSVLEKLDSWTLDNTRHVLILGSPGKSPSSRVPPSGQPSGTQASATPIKPGRPPLKAYDKVDCYDRPSTTDGSVVKQLGYSTWVTILHETEEWAQIEIPSGEKGWILRRYLSGSGEGRMVKIARP